MAFPIGAKSPDELGTIFRQAIENQQAKGERPIDLAYQRGVAGVVPQPGARGRSGPMRMAGENPEQIARAAIVPGLGGDGPFGRLTDDPRKKTAFRTYMDRVTNSPVMPEYSGLGLPESKNNKEVA